MLLKQLQMLRIKQVMPWISDFVLFLNIYILRNIKKNDERFTN
jgi:hypothetical protein